MTVYLTQAELLHYLTELLQNKGLVEGNDKVIGLTQTAAVDVNQCVWELNIEVYWVAGENTIKL